MADRRIPDRADCLVGELLDRRAAAMGDSLAVSFDDGSAWSYAELRTRVRELAAGLQALGVARQELVLSWLPNGPRALALWYAVNYIGAIHVPINTAYRGALLAHVIENSGARLMVADARLVGHLDGLDLSTLRRVVTVGEDAPRQRDDLEFLPGSGLTVAGSEPAAPAEALQPWDTMLVMYTSGTTGPSKGVLISYVQAHSASHAHYWITGEDRALVTLPMFHTGGTWPSYRALVTGGSLALAAGYTTESFWRVVRERRATTVTLLSAMISFLVRQPPSPQDREHLLRSASVVPINADAIAFGARFGVDVYTSFGMTEISAPIACGPNPKLAGSCGKPRAGIEARIVDNNDCELAVGAVGELMLRADVPWAFNHGYHGNPEATARAWRNGWFHTGDAFRRDAEGNFFFVDRLKDAIRRRGENVSAFEVERELLAHAAVADAAVVGIRSAHGEDDILAVVVRRESAALEPLALFEFLRPRMAHFMLPRYIRWAEQLPRTHTHRVQKYLLRQLTDDTWDREAAGVEVRREKLD